MNAAFAYGRNFFSSLIWLHVFAVVLVICAPVHALTLGSVRGEAWMGRALGINVPVQLDAGEAAASVCTQVEVFFADNRVDSGRIRSGWLNPEASGEGVLRIETTVAVDEPVVNVHVRVGCVRANARKYVLLADIPVESGRSSAVALPVAASPGAPATLTQPVMPLEPNADRPAVTGRTPTEGPLAGKARPIPKPVRKPSSSVADHHAESVATAAVVPVVSKPEGKAGHSTSKRKDGGLSDAKSRLTLEGLTEFSPNLKSSLDLVTTPTEDASIRESAKTMWRSLNLSPEERARDASRLQALETQVKALESSSAKQDQVQAALKTQLAKAEDERYANALVGVLAALLLSALGVAGYFWFRLRNSRFAANHDWWRGQSVEPSILSDLPPAGDENDLMRSARPALRQRADAESLADDSIYDSLVKADSSRREGHGSRQSSSGDSAMPRSGFFHSSLGTRSVNVEELFDVQQQAEFFVSLGQHEQAMSLLQQHIYGATNTSGLAYLDLLELYYQFERHAEYDQLREEFNRLFMGEVPTFEHYRRQSRGIVRYENVMRRIESQWKTPQILDTLQELIFRHPEAGVQDEESFDLTAYRELMLLFTIAKDTAEHNPGVTDLGHGAASPGLDDLVADGLSVGALGERLPDASSGNLRFASVDPYDNDDPLSTRSSVLMPSSPAPAGLASTASDVDLSLIPEIPKPKPSSRLGLDVDLFELESGVSPLGDARVDIDLNPSPAFEFSMFKHVTLDHGKPKSDIPSGVETAPAPAPVAPLDLDLDIEQYLKNNKTS